MNVKKFLPHIIAVAVFVVISSVFFSPVIFDGKKLKQSDIANWQGASKEIVDFRDKNNSEPLWTNSMFGGMPAYQISTFYKGNLIRFVDEAISLGLPSPLNYLFIYLLGFYFLLITLKVDQRLAVLGAIGFAFSSYFLIILEVGHNSKAGAIGYMAPVIAGIIMTYRGRLLLGGALTALFLALELNAGHPQITYYLLLTVVLLGIAELYNAVKEKKLNYFIKASLILIVGGMLAVGTNITSTMATAEYGKYSTRGPSELTSDKDNQTSGLDRDYITSWSYGKSETMTLMIPNYKGGASEAIGNFDKDALKDVDPNFKQNIASFSAYFGDQPFTQGPVYIGAILCLLFVLGLFIVKGPIKWWLLSATVLSIFLAWGKHFMGFTDFFLDYVPGYDKFRSVSMILVIAEFTIPLLAVLALNELINSYESSFSRKAKAHQQLQNNNAEGERKPIAQVSSKTVNYIMGAMLAISLLIAASPGIFTDKFYSDEEYNRAVEQTKGQKISKETLNTFFDGVETARKAIVASDAWRTFIFLLLASALIFAFNKYRFRKEFLIFGLLLLVGVDVISVGSRYIDKKDYVSKSAYNTPFPMSHADELIRQDPSSYRVLNLAANTFNDASTSYYHQSIGGYHGAKLKRYKELIDYRLTPEMGALQASLNKGDTAVRMALKSQSSLNMLNSKYIIYNPDAPPIVNNNVLGNAWFVNEYKIVPNADSEIAALNNFNPKTTAIIDQRFKSNLDAFKSFSDSTASITLLSYQPNDLVYESKSNAEGLAVFSEIYYDKGWNVYVDGQLSPYFRTNYVLRGMLVPSGNHKIEWKFEPSVYYTGEKISLASSILLLLMVAGVGFTKWKKNNINE